MNPDIVWIYTGWLSHTLDDEITAFINEFVEYGSMRREKIRYNTV